MAPQGYRTLMAESGEEAIELIRQHEVHLALMDMHLPRISGLETIAILRQIKGVIPAILITGDQDDNLMRRALVRACVLRARQAGQQARRDLRRAQGDREVLQLTTRRLVCFLRRHRLAGLTSVLAWAASLAAAAHGHDIPNQRVDRSIQVTLTPGRLEIDYEVSLTELTLTQDLRR